MKERPILFSAPMVRAILECRKTQTRRIVKPQPNEIVTAVRAHPSEANRWQFQLCDGGEWNSYSEKSKCPYGQPGDRLWIREEHYQCGYWQPVEGVKTKQGRRKWKFVPTAPTVLFADELTEDFEFRKGRHSKDPETIAWHKRLARFMPRKYSRTLLEVVSVRVERLQDISDHDAIAEGIEWGRHEPKFEMEGWRMYGAAGITNDPRLSYRTLWDSINGAGAWEKNPFVWVVEFRRCAAMTNAE